MKRKYVSIIDDTGRTSSLDVTFTDTFTVVGVLPHNSEIQPASIKDAEKFIKWLKNYIDAVKFDDAYGDE